MNFVDFYWWSLVLSFCAVFAYEVAVNSTFLKYTYPFFCMFHPATREAFQFCKENNIKVVFKPIACSGIANFPIREIWINTGMSLENTLGSFVHEHYHFTMLGQRTEIKSESSPELCTGLRMIEEFEAYRRQFSYQRVEMSDLELCEYINSCYCKYFVSYNNGHKAVWSSLTEKFYV